MANTIVSNRNTLLFLFVVLVTQLTAVSAANSTSSKSSGESVSLSFSSGLIGAFLASVVALLV